MKTSLWWRIGTAALVLGSIVYTSTAPRKAIAARKNKEEEIDGDTVLPEYRRTFDENPLLPDTWTFGAVWSTIYAGTAAYAIHQALPSQENNARYRQALPWLAASYALNAVFGKFFAKPGMEDQIGADLVTKATLPLSIGLHQALEIGQTRVEGPEKYLRIPFSLYAGWLTTATVVGTPNLLLNLKVWKPDSQRDTPVFVGILGATTGAAYTIARRLNDPFYLLPFVAGFAGIATKQYGKNKVVALPAATFSLVTAGIVAKWVPKGKFEPINRKVIEIQPGEEVIVFDRDDEPQNEEAESYSYTSL
ncbi:tryptophan-rich sensory protein [Larkinella sp. VNQ87]|uniref:tryptophan-rich sensory protein n=1 Tax=Larkinella sp. VNQ87 TaxID=3400921 RepID=UPI003C059449